MTEDEKRHLKACDALDRLLNKHCGDDVADRVLLLVNTLGGEIESYSECPGCRAKLYKLALDMLGNIFRRSEENGNGEGIRRH